MMGFISCRNSDCKFWFEDSCMINMKGKLVHFDYEGKCESAKPGKFEEGSDE